MKNFTFLLCLIFVAHLGYAQSGWRPDILFPTYSTESFEKKTTAKLTGSPYLDDDFKAGTVMDENGNEQGALLRYNALEDIVEIKIVSSDSTDIRVLPKVKELSYSIDGNKYIFDSFLTDKGEQTEKFFIEYYKGDSYALYGKPSPKLSIAKIPNTSYENYKPANLSVDVDYYIKKEDGKLYNIKLKNKDFKNLFPKSKEVNRYLAENKLKTPQDYSRVLQLIENSGFSNPNNIQ